MDIVIYYRDEHQMDQGVGLHGTISHEKQMARYPPLASKETQPTHYFKASPSDIIIEHRLFVWRYEVAPKRRCYKLHHKRSGLY